MTWQVVSLIAVVVITVLCVNYYFTQSSDPTCPWTCTLPPSMTGSVEPLPLPADMQPASTVSSQPLQEALDDKIALIARLLTRIGLLERAQIQNALAIRTMSDVRQVGMLAQFNELDGEYNRLFERHAKVQQELFDAQAAVRTLSRMAQKI